MLKNWCWGWHSLRIQPSLLHWGVSFGETSWKERGETDLFESLKDNSVAKILWVLFFNFDDYDGFDDGDGGGFDGGFNDGCKAS